MCSSVLCVTLSCTVSPLPQLEYGKIWQVNLVESGFDLGLLNVSFSAKFHGENDQACVRVCHGTFCLEAGPFRCCWRPMSNLQHPFHTERLKEGHISNCTIYSRICDEDFPRSNIWSNTQKSGHKLLRKLPTPEIWAGFHWTWRIQTKKNARSYTCIRLLGLTSRCHYGHCKKKDLRQCCSHYLSLTYSYSVRNAHLSIWFYLYILLGNKSNGLTGCSNI